MRGARVALDLDGTEMNERQTLNASTFEKGRPGLRDCLGGVFRRDRPFGRAVVWGFLCAQSEPCPE